MKEQTQLVKAAPGTANSIERPLPTGNSLSSGYLYDTSPESEHIAYLKEFLRSIRKHLLLVLGLTLFVTVGAVVYNSRKPDIFQANAQVRVDQESNPGSMAVGKNAQVFVNGSEFMDYQYFNTQLQILTGQALIRQVVKELDLQHNPNFLRSPTANRTVTQSLAHMFGFDKEATAAKNDKTPLPVAPAKTSLTTPQTPVTTEDKMEEARQLAPYVGRIMTGLKVTQVRETRLINITYEHTDPQIAAKVVNSIADAYVRMNMISKTGTMENQGEFLKKRIAELQEDIRKTEQQRTEYAKRQGFLEIDKGQDYVVDRLTKLSGELVEAENARRLAEAQYKISGEQQVVNADISKEIEPLQTRLAELERDKVQLLEQFTPEWPGVKKVQAEIDLLKKQIDDLKSNKSSNARTLLEARYREALKREQDLRDAFNKQKGETRQQNEAAVNYRIILQEIDTKKKLLDDLIERDKQADILRQGNVNNVIVQEWGMTPELPIGPKRTQSIFMAMLLSLGFGVGLARLLDYLDTTVRTVQDIEKHLRLPVLSLIPAVGSWRRIASSTALQKFDGSSASDELLINKNLAHSPLAETYRQLRTSILLSTAGRAPRTLLVTSSQASEGKTTNAVNIAHTLTQTGAKVLLVDADMRRPRLHNIFQIDNLHGLSTALASEMSEAEILSSISQYQETGIYVLPSGPLPPNPSELLSSDAMRRLLSVLDDIFTHIVIDSPPITLVTDSVILGSMVDGVLLVVQGDRTSRELVRRSQRLLHEVGARIFGVILNNVNVKPEDYYYYQSYYGSRYYSDNAAAYNGNGNGNGSKANQSKEDE